MATSITWAGTCRFGASVNCPARLRRLPCFPWRYLAARLGLGFWLLRGSVEILSQCCLCSVYIQRHLAPEEHLALDAALSNNMLYHFIHEI